MTDEPLYFGCTFKILLPGTSENNFLDRVSLVTHVASGEEISVSGTLTRYKVAQLLELSYRISSLDIF
jgi:hypothetical protein